MGSIFVKPKFIELHQLKDTTRSIFVNANQIVSIESSNIYSYATFVYLSSDKKITVSESINRIMELLEED